MEMNPDEKKSFRNKMKTQVLQRRVNRSLFHVVKKSVGQEKISTLDLTCFSSNRLFHTQEREVRTYFNMVFLLRTVLFLSA